MGIPRSHNSDSLQKPSQSSPLFSLPQVNPRFYPGFYPRSTPGQHHSPLISTSPIVPSHPTLPKRNSDPFTRLYRLPRHYPNLRASSPRVGRNVIAFAACGTRPISTLANLDMTRHDSPRHTWMGPVFFLFFPSVREVEPITCKTTTPGTQKPPPRLSSVWITMASRSG